MSDRTLNPTPHWSVPLRGHLSILLRFRGFWLLPALIAVTYGWGILSRLQRALLAPSLEFGTRLPTSYLELIRVPVSPPIPVFVRIMALLGILALIWALAVWQEEPWGKRDYMWSLPVNRPTHDLMRALAGALHLLGALLLFVLIGVYLARLAGEPLFPPGSWSIWILIFLYPLLIYLFFSIPALSAKTPLLWVALAGIATPGIMILTQDKDPGVVVNFVSRVLIGIPEGPGIINAVASGIRTGRNAWLPETTRGSLITDAPIAPHWFLLIAVWTVLIVFGLSLAARRKV